MNIYDIPDINESEFSFGTVKGLPMYNDIPEEFRPACRIFYPGQEVPEDGPMRWIVFIEDVFFNGLKDLKLYPREGVDSEKAWKHIRALMRSWSSEHNHKTYGCAYLMSLYFEKVEWEVVEKEVEKEDLSTE